MGQATPMKVDHYDLYDLVYLRATVLGTDGAPAQPSFFAFIVRSPSAVACYAYEEAGASVAIATSGCFYKAITANVVGTWPYRAHATGLIQANEEHVFIVDPSDVL